MNFKDHLKGLEKLRDSTRSSHGDGHARKGYAHGGSIKDKMNTLASEGRYGDTKLAEIGPRTARVLDKVIHGGKRDINPRTGLREYPPKVNDSSSDSSTTTSSEDEGDTTSSSFETTPFYKHNPNRPRQEGRTCKPSVRHVVHDYHYPDLAVDSLREHMDDLHARHEASPTLDTYEGIKEKNKPINKSIQSMMVASRLKENPIWTRPKNNPRFPRVREIGDLLEANKHPHELSMVNSKRNEKKSMRKGADSYRSHAVTLVKASKTGGEGFLHYLDSNHPKKITKSQYNPDTGEITNLNKGGKSYTLNRITKIDPYNEIDDAANPLVPPKRRPPIRKLGIPLSPSPSPEKPPKRQRIIEKKPNLKRISRKNIVPSDY